MIKIRRPVTDWRPSRSQLAAGQQLAEFLDTPRKWIHRRVESVIFIDDSTVRRRVSVDLTVPKGLRLVPLTTLRKDLLVDLDTQDETGRGLPVATRAHNSDVGWLILLSRAQAALATANRAVSREQSRDLRLLVAAPDEVALEALDRVTREDTPGGAALSRDHAFYGVAELLAQEFLLLVHVEADETARRLLKFSYVEQLEEPSLLAGALAVLGVRRSSLLFDVPGVSRARSFHFECELPSELELQEAALLVEEEEDFHVGDHALRGSRGHLYFSQALSNRAEGSAIVFFQRNRTGFVRIAWASALFTALTLTWFESHISDVKADDSGATTILVAIPGLLSLLATRQGEHRLASRLFFGSRVLVGVCGLLAYAAAASLSVELDEVDFRAIWTVFVVLSWACFGMLSLGVLRLDWLVDRFWVFFYEARIWWTERRSRFDQVDTQ